MAFIRSIFQFLTGTVVGIYVAQNYNVPNIDKLSKTFLLISKHLEETYRKPKNRVSDEGESEI